MKKEEPVVSDERYKSRMHDANFLTIIDITDKRIPRNGTSFFRNPSREIPAGLDRNSCRRWSSSINYASVHGRLCFRRVESNRCPLDLFLLVLKRTRSNARQRARNGYGDDGWTFQRFQRTFRRKNTNTFLETMKTSSCGKIRGKRSKYQVTGFLFAPF